MTVDIELFDAIGIGPRGITPQAIKSALAEAGGEEITVRIDSEGGSVFNGFSIYSAFQAYEGKKTCVIESAAFSIASYVAMAFDRVQITSNGYLMIHNPSVEAVGDDEDLSKQAELLRKLKTSMVDAYAAKTRMPPETIERMMERETYLNAEEALAAGFVDEIVDYSKPSRVVEAKHSNEIPLRVVAALGSGGHVATEEPKPVESEEVKPMAATVKAIKQKYPMASSDFIVKAMEEEMTEEQVAEELIKELTAQNKELMGKLAAMEEYMDKAKAESMEEEEKEEEVAEEEEKVETKAAKRGSAPVARVPSASAPKKTAQARWREAIDGYVAKGMSRQRAAQYVNRDYPELREQLIEEANR